jgi:hypothetical protein
MPARKPPKPQIFYDTSICVAAARENITQEEWRTVARFVSRRFRYRNSPVTVDELLRGIYLGGPEQFLKTKKALGLVYPAHQKEFLPPPGNFVMENLFGYRFVHWRNSALMHRLVKSFLKTAKAETLYSTKIWNGKTAFLRTANSETQYSSGKNITPVDALFRTNYNYLQNAKEVALMWETNRLSVGRKPFSAAYWIGEQLQHYGEPNTPENRSKVEAGLSAAYHFAKFLRNAQKDVGYDFFEHSSDKEDLKQLHYLADPSVHFVTGDARLQKHIAASPQAPRVLRWRDLYEMAKGEEK